MKKVWVGVRQRFVLENGTCCEPHYVSLEMDLEKALDIMSVAMAVKHFNETYMKETGYLRIDVMEINLDKVVWNLDHTQCALCNCTMAGIVFGFPVCAYHLTHGEDDPSCPNCGHPR